MAIYHFSVKMISRSTGRSSTACAAYRGGLDITDERTGQRFDYSNKGKKGVLDHAILTPSRAPDWAKSPATLWNSVEAFEKRKDSQVARENIVALPHELSLEQNKALLHGFVQEAYIKRGMVAQVDIHTPDEKGSNKNIHAHILLTTRQVTRNGFKEKKARSWNEKETLKEWRTLWAEHMNRALEKAGHEERVDSRSFKDQGINDQEPTTHMGVEATAMERRGEESRQGDKNRIVEEANKNVAQLKKESKIIDLAIVREEKKQEAEAERQQNQIQSLASTEYQSQEAHYQLKSAQREILFAFDTQAQAARRKEQQKLDQFYGTKQAQRDLKQAQQDLKTKNGWFSRVTGGMEKQQDKIGVLQLNLGSITQRQTEAMGKLNAQLERDKKALIVRQQQERKAFENSPLQKQGTSKNFEKSVLKKEIANENQKSAQRQEPSRNRGREPQ